MSAFKSTLATIAWLASFIILYWAETRSWPEAKNWHLLDWHPWALGFINSLIVNGVVNFWKSMRKGNS